MKDIKQLSDHIKEEIEDAEEYIREAIECKEHNKQKADLYAKLAEEELKHMDMLHEEVVKEISNYKKVEGDPPVEMQARYDILHEIYTSDANKVKLMIKLYKGE